MSHLYIMEENKGTENQSMNSQSIVPPKQELLNIRKRGRKRVFTDEERKVRKADTYKRYRCRNLIRYKLYNKSKYLKNEYGVSSEFLKRLSPHGRTVLTVGRRILGLAIESPALALIVIYHDMSGGLDGVVKKEQLEGLRRSIHGLVRNVSKVKVIGPVYLLAAVSYDTIDLIGIRHDSELSL